MVGVVVAASLVVGACAKKEEPLGPTATVPQATTTNPYAVPSVIDESYVNRVLAGLDQAVGDVVRLVVSTKAIPPEAMERLEAIYVGDDILQLRVRLFQDDLKRDLASYLPTPGNQVSRVTELISVSPECVFAAIERDYSQVSVVPPGDPHRQWVALRPSSRSQDALNPTPWVYVYDGFAPGRVQPPDPCEG